MCVCVGGRGVLGQGLAVILSFDLQKAKVLVPNPSVFTVLQDDAHCLIRGIMTETLTETEAQAGIV